MYFCESAKALSKRNRIYYKFNISFASHAVAYLIFGLIIPKIQNYERNDRVEYTIVLLLSAIIVFLYFSVEINFSVRNREFELTSTLKNCFLTYALFGVMLILTKNPIIDSRYLFYHHLLFTLRFLFWEDMFLSII